jgi:hypothetical protein
LLIKNRKGNLMPIFCVLFLAVVFALITVLFFVYACDEHDTFGLLVAGPSLLIAILLLTWGVSADTYDHPLNHSVELEIFQQDGSYYVIDEEHVAGGNRELVNVNKHFGVQVNEGDKVYRDYYDGCYSKSLWNYPYEALRFKAAD